MTTLFFVPLLFGAAFAFPAQAEDHTETISATVLHADLDLSNPTAQRRLQSRVRAAVRDICSAPGLDLRAAQKVAECRRLALAQADTQIRVAVARARLQKARFAATLKDPAA